MLKLTLVVGKIHLFIAAGLRSCFLLAISQGCFFSTCNGTLYSVRQFASSRAAGEHFWPQGRLCPLLKGFQLIMSCSPKIVYLLINLKTADFWNSITSVKCLHPAIYHKLITGVTSIIFAIYCNQGWEVMGVTVLFPSGNLLWSPVSTFMSGTLYETLYLCVCLPHWNMSSSKTRRAFYFCIPGTWM